MNPIMQGLNQPAQPQQGIASLAPTPPTQATPPPQMTPPPGGIQPIHNQEFIDPGVGQFNPPSSAFPDPSAPTDQFGNTIGWNPPPINLFPSQPPGYQPPGVQPGPGMGTFDHLTDNPYVQGPPDNFVTIEGVRYNVPPVSQPGAIPPQQTPTPPPQQVGGGMYFPGGNPGFDESAPYGQQFNPNQGIASLAGTNPGI